METNGFAMFSEADTKAIKYRQKMDSHLQPIA
jgi:hypothetical protein